MRDVELAFTYEQWFCRRRGWRMRPEIKATIPIDADARFRARALILHFHEGDPSDIQQFINRYELRIDSPAAWFQAIPVPSSGHEHEHEPGDTWRRILTPEIQVEQRGVIEISFRGQPFAPLKNRLVWTLAISGAKVYRIEARQ
jgi:hypothetical protein